jgi:alpha 1,2-mannosyltransferase
MEVRRWRMKLNQTRALLLANHFGENHRFYYKFLMGDKDLFRFAFRALKQPYHMIEKWITIVGHLHEKYILCGHSMLQNDPDGKPLFMHANLVKLYSDELMSQVASSNGFPDNYYFFHYAKYADHADPNYKFGLSFDYQRGWVY